MEQNKICNIVDTLSIKTLVFKNRFLNESNYMIELYGHSYDISVEYCSIYSDDILDIHKYLMEE